MYTYAVQAKSCKLKAESYGDVCSVQCDVCGLCVTTFILHDFRLLVLQALCANGGTGPSETSSLGLWTLDRATNQPNHQY